MMKVKKNVASLLMSMVMLVAFCIPTMAVDTNIESSIDLLTATNEVELDYSAQPKFPGSTGIYGVLAYPAIVGTHQYAPDYYTVNNSGTGRNQWLHLTLDSRTSQAYRQAGCDGFFVQASINLSGATRYELFNNNTLVDSGSCAGASSGTVTLFVDNENPGIWELVLYDNITPTQGKPMWGHIYLS